MIRRDESKLDHDIAQHRDWLHRFARRFVGDDFSADDIVQDTFLKALEQEDPTTVNNRAWLAATARNLSFTSWRSGMRRKRREANALTRDASSPAPREEETEFLHEIEIALESLPGKVREVTISRYLDGMRPRDIAQHLGMPTKSVYLALEKGRRSLRHRLQGRFGRDWQALGTGLLGLPSFTSADANASAPVVPKSSSPIPFLAGLAVLALGAAGYWIHGGNHGTATEGPRNDSLVASVLSQEGPVLSRDSKSAFSSFGLSSGNTVRVLAVDQDGTPLEHARLELRYEGIGNDPLRFTTGADGEAIFTPPTDATGFYLKGRAEGLWTTSLHLDRPFSTRHELVFQVGQFPLEYVVEEGTPGVALEVTGRAYPHSMQHWFGLITTDRQGRASLPVPVHGQYRVSPVDSLGSDTDTTIEYGPGFQPGPAVVSYQAPGPMEIEVVVKGTSSILDSARFYLAEEAERVEGLQLYTYQELPVAGGRLAAPNPTKAWRYGLVVRAEGHRDARVSVHGRQDGPLQVHLDPVRYERARLTSAIEDVQWTDLQILEVVPLFSFLPLNLGWRPSMNGFVLRSLDISGDGVFQLPRVVDGEDGRFHLIATDSLGRRHVALDLKAELRSQPLPEFPMTLSAEGALRFLAPSAWPHSASERILGGWMDAWEHPDRRLTPDQQGVFSVPGARGSQVWILYRTRDLHYIQIQRVPWEEGEAPVHLADFPRDGQLRGTLVQADGSPLPPETVIRARFNGHLDAHDLPGGTDAEFLLYLRPEGDQLHSVPCPRGEYDLELSLGNQLLRFEDVPTGIDFHLRVPDLQMILANARDRDSGLPLHAALYRIPEGGHKKVHLKWTDARSGHVATAYSEYLDLSRWALATWKYEPFVLDQAIPGMMFTADLIPGRALRLDPSPMGIQPIEGNRWICSTWGNQNDPRQAFISVFQNRIDHLHAPATEFEMLELGPDGTYTGRSFLVHEDGSLTDTSS